MRKVHSFLPPFYAVESVTSGHPDKVCDQISDAILDACLAGDPNSRVAVETFGSHGKLMIGGEITTSAIVDYESIARRVYAEIGYTDDLEVISHVTEQSSDIAQGVNTGGAGDQGIMYGYATDQTSAYLPQGNVYVHAMAKALEDLRKSGDVEWLLPDGKTQVTMLDGRVTSVLISTQHKEGVSQEEIKSTLIEKVIAPIIGSVEDVEVLVNPTGIFLAGGFEADAGLTGRKIMVDTYGGVMPHGGGAFSGKDPTKVDRSAAYMCRFVAKNIVAAGLAHECLISVAYAIGHTEPLMVEAINEYGDSIREVVEKHFDFRPEAIVERLDLKRPIYQRTASYGHFGRDGVPWEEIIALD